MPGRQTGRRPSRQSKWRAQNPGRVVLGSFSRRFSDAVARGRSVRQPVAAATARRLLPDWQRPAAKEPVRRRPPHL